MGSHDASGVAVSGSRQSSKPRYWSAFSWSMVAWAADQLPPSVGGLASADHVMSSSLS